MERGWYLCVYNTDNGPVRGVCYCDNKHWYTRDGYPVRITSCLEHIPNYTPNHQFTIKNKVNGNVTER